jgi:hypothetical protein
MPLHILTLDNFDILDSVFFIEKSDKVYFSYYRESKFIVVSTMPCIHSVSTHKNHACWTMEKFFLPLFDFPLIFG